MQTRVYPYTAARTSYFTRKDRTNSSKARNSSSGQENSSKKIRSPDFKYGARVVRTKSVDVNMSASRLITMRPDKSFLATNLGSVSWNKPTSKLQRESLISGIIPLALKCPANSVGRHLSGRPVKVSKPTKRDSRCKTPSSHNRRESPRYTPNSR